MIESNQCPNCGAALSLFPTLNRAICNYCNSNFWFRSDSRIDDFAISSSDNPASITIEREEVSVLELSAASVPFIRCNRELFNTYKGLRFDKTADASSFEAELVYFLAVVSGLAFQLKKNYPVEIKMGDIVTISERDAKKAKKQGYRKGNKADVERKLDFLNSQNSVHASKIGLLQQYGFTKHETEHFSYYAVTRNYGGTPDIQVPCKETFTTCATIISPSYFEKHFPTIVEAYNRVKVREELALINEKVLRSYESIDLSSLPAFQPLQLAAVDGASVGCIGRGSFSEVGMMPASNLEIALAIQIAVIGRFILQTAEDTGKYLWDLSTKRGFTDKNHAYHPNELGIRYLLKTVKHYNEW